VASYVEPSNARRGSEDRISDEELTALALASDPTIPLDADARPWSGGSSLMPGLLPDWYMAPPVASRRRSATAIVITVIVIGFLVIDAFGLCITSGFLSLA